MNIIIIIINSFYFFAVTKKYAPSVYAEKKILGGTTIIGWYRQIVMQVLETNNTK